MSEGFFPNKFHGNQISVLQFIWTPSSNEEGEELSNRLVIRAKTHIVGNQLMHKISRYLIVVYVVIFGGKIFEFFFSA